jgi:hypothetical protein
LLERLNQADAGISLLEVLTQIEAEPFSQGVKA